MRVVFLGPPGAGKGTQARLLAEGEGVPHVATGDLFRAAVASGTELGRRVAGFLQAGRLVPDEVTVAVVAERLARDDCKAGFVLDGFPRTVAQAEALEEVLRERGWLLDAVLALEVSAAEVVRRLAGRRVCSVCGANYHVEFRPPARAGVCDACGGALVQRPDDREETIRVRLSVYRQEAEPVVDHYRQQGLLRVVDGDRPAAEVAREVARLVGGRAPAHP